MSEQIKKLLKMTELKETITSCLLKFIYYFIFFEHIVCFSKKVIVVCVIYLILTPSCDLLLK